MNDLEKNSREAIKNRQPPELTAVQPEVRYLTISADDAGQRVDNFLLRICKGAPKSLIYRILRSGEVRVNKGRIEPTYRLVRGDVVRLPPLRLSQAERAVAPRADFPVLYEDSHLLIIDKPAGRAVHGGSGVSYGVIEQLRAGRTDAKFLELVHRLDRETSGILVIAKKRSALLNLHEQMRTGKIDKRYLALVCGKWKNVRQHIKLALKKYSTAEGERRVRVQADGLASHTVFNLLRRYDDYSLLEAELKTGRTHQIRVHLASTGYPIAGDDKYGDFALNRELQRSGRHAFPLKRMFLHAYQISFTHPETGKLVTVKAPLAAECQRFLSSLESADDLTPPGSDLGKSS